MSESFSAARKPDGIHNTHRVPLFCPRCGSHVIQTKNRGKKLGGALGTCAGVMSALSGTAKGATVGAAVSLRAVSPYTPMNSLTVAVLGAFVGGLPDDLITVVTIIWMQRGDAPFTTLEYIRNLRII